MARKERYLVGLDVGTSKITALVGEAGDEGELDIIGIGLADSKGIRRGVVVNLEAAVESIKKAIDEAELTAGVEIDSVHLGLSGAHVKAFNSRGVVAVAGKNREITREDVRRAIDAAKAVSLPTGREILHVLPQDFVVDEQDGIGAPVGMTGSRLEVNVHVVTGSASSTQNVVACVNRAGVAVLDTVLEQLAASEAVLTQDEKELGVALVDIGGGTTDFAIFERGSLWHTGVVAVGGDHFTNDIAVGLRTPIPDAEKIKRRCGCALSSMVDEDETMEVASVGGRKPRVMARRILSEILQPRAEEIFHLLWDEIRKAGFEKMEVASVGGRKPRLMPRRVLSEILQPRAEEIFHLLWDEIRKAGFEKALNSGIVLTGGGAMLEGVAEIAEQIFDLPIRRGAPAGVGGLADHVASPAFATAVGVVMYAHRNQAGEPARTVGAGTFGRVAGRLRGLFKEFL
jgi:cell division protein FtsA